MVFKQNKNRNVKMNEEKYYQIIDNSFGDYLRTYKGNFVMDKEEFINAIKTNPEFSERWGLKIEERELSDDERYNLLSDGEKKSFIVATIPGLKYGEEIKYSLNTFYPHIPTRQITLTHNGTKIEVYE